MYEKVLDYALMIGAILVLAGILDCLGFFDTQVIIVHDARVATGR